MYARPGIGVNLSWESRGGEVCGTRGLAGTAVAATGSRFPPSPYRGQRLPAQKPCAGRLAKTIVQSPPARRRRVGAAYPLVSGTGQALRRTAASRSYKWRKQGPWDRLLDWGNRKLTLPGRSTGKSMAWMLPSFRRITRRQRKKGGDQALGRSRGGFGTEVHVRVESAGKPVVFVLTPGQQISDGGEFATPSQGKGTSGATPPEPALSRADGTGSCTENATWWSGKSTS